MLNPLTAPLLALVAALSLMPLGACTDPSENIETLTPEESVEVVVPVDYSIPLSLSEAVSDEWFEDTAFIGHSLIQGFSGYSGLTQPDYYYLAGSSVKNLLSSGNVTQPDESQGTLASGLAKQTYQRVYLMMGINEVAGQRASLKADYLELINLVRAYNPDAEIYVLAVLPVSYNKSAAGTFTITRILAYNEMLRELCGEEQCWYVDLYSCFANEDGYLPSAATSDGIHLKAAQYKVMLDYLRTHTAE